MRSILLAIACSIGANTLLFDAVHRKNEDAFSSPQISRIAQNQGLLTYAEKTLLARNDSPVKGDLPGFSIWYNTTIFAGVLLLVAYLDRATKE